MTVSCASHCRTSKRHFLRTLQRLWRRKSSAYPSAVFQAVPWFDSLVVIYSYSVLSAVASVPGRLIGTPALWWPLGGLPPMCLAAAHRDSQFLAVCRELSEHRPNKTDWLVSADFCLVKHHRFFSKRHNLVVRIRWFNWLMVSTQCFLLIHIFPIVNTSRNLSSTLQRLSLDFVGLHTLGNHRPPSTITWFAVRTPS
ncbi:hypothetical protein BD626DRAFT_481190 [Schizophyllum amplum]|uniref:Uncharacterized protein n=1 Tax=Schizophyllum amplum TaxID=97359 RepID=A0A550CTX8_9AGAR|nr:hypothetical protein BD626DRAFT_481190 [Auriculariopsis ampla]